MENKPRKATQLNARQLGSSAWGRSAREDGDPRGTHSLELGPYGAIRGDAGGRAQQKEVAVPISAHLRDYQGESFLSTKYLGSQLVC